ncbi:MAG TPA: winged helix DNA-binding domain-containing protein [Solirubrobacteraceae bacterium]|nr:winged helix DNA-binding domain-containing protein [Solirubrobacteraceae bacterium]
MRTIGDHERRARLARRHGLAAQHRFADVEQVADAIVALHATDPASVFLSARARLREPSISAIEAALYEQRTLVRLLGMRRTMFIVPTVLAGVVQASSTRALVPGERKRFAALLEESGVAADGTRWLRETEEATYAALVARGEATAAELTEDVPALRARTPVAQGKAYASIQGVSTRVLFLLAAEGRIVRGRPLGSWTSTLYRWAPASSWLPAPMEELDTDAASAELVRRWLNAFGPGTLADIKWWTGWTMGLVKRALAQLDTVEVALASGASGLVLAEDAEPVGAPAPWVALLPALDPAAMGWQERAWYLGEHRASCFDRSGNIGPTVWCDGRIVGGWAQRKDTGEVVVRLLEDVGSEAAQAVADEAARVRDWVGDVRVTPRFRTPLERELSEPRASSPS